MDIPPIAIGLVFGKGGVTLADIERKTGAKIYWAETGKEVRGVPMTALMSGTEDQLMMAACRINELVRLSGAHLDGQPGVISRTIQVPASAVGMIIGKGGENVKKISLESGAHVEIAKHIDPNARIKEFIIRGRPEDIEKAEIIIRKYVHIEQSWTPSAALSATPSATSSRNYSTFSISATASDHPATASDHPATASIHPATASDHPVKRQYYDERPVIDESLFHLSGEVNPDELIGAARTEGLFVDDDEDDLGEDLLKEWIKYYESMGMVEKAEEMRNRLKKQHDASI